MSTGELSLFFTRHYWGILDSGTSVCKTSELLVPRRRIYPHKLKPLSVAQCWVIIAVCHKTARYLTWLCVEHTYTSDIYQPY